MIYLTLFYEFFKIGLFAVGGGLATIPFLMDIADKYPWLTREMLADMIAVSESTPGPIGVNMATYAGFEAAGVAGALTATFSLVLPSFLVILLIARFLQKYNSSPLVQSTFSLSLIHIFCLRRLRTFFAKKVLRTPKNAQGII